MYTYRENTWLTHQPSLDLPAYVYIPGEYLAHTAAIIRATSMCTHTRRILGSHTNDPYSYQHVYTQGEYLAHTPAILRATSMCTHRENTWLTHQPSLELPECVHTQGILGSHTSHP